jgi:hypothetical protein
MTRLFLWSAATCRGFVFYPTVECSIRESADKSAHSKELRYIPSATLRILLTPSAKRSNEVA